MKRNQSVQVLTLTALLIALAIIIPMNPFSIRFEPFFSYTLASHVPLFFAMFVSPLCAILVAVGSAIGFLFSTGNPMIVARATSHIIFAIIGSYWLKNKSSQCDTFKGRMLFSINIAFIHALCEFLAVVPFVLDGLTMSFIWTMFFFLIVLGMVHSMIDFEIAYRVVSVTFRKKKHI
ncbi:hypothetical protein AOC36_00325 [Erysipelothrix larvae]|uniref:Niacin transporter NiaX n=1 Tax=Erysipelothrix larvae TaxID=1514105 RepID=A0A109UGC2_9FIRM|nr:hypothetical protein [Erysipelothrix larvae]AMC92492.1 hypothetical protein AOC36_00325 [Erysipelothrix larvae]